LKTVTEGFVLGVIISAMIGPVFFLILQISISKGVFAGLLAGIGSLLSDVIILIFCMSGLNLAGPGIFSEKWIGLVGVFIIAFTGLAIIFAPKLKHVTAPFTNFSAPVSTTMAFVQGFSINTFNPFVFVFWTGVAGMIKERYDGYGNTYIFMAGLFASISILNVLKVVLPHRVKILLTPKILYSISLLCGTALVLFASILGFRILWE
jgi:threonine/homoserine/homoserine lactone efflux protein